MEARIFAQNKSPTLTSAHWKLIKHNPQYPSVVAVLTRPSSDDIAGETRKKNVYKDNFFNLLAINHLSKSVQAASGFSNKKSGYESFVEAATVTSQNFNLIQQREVVIQALYRAFPKPILSLIRIVLPQSKLAREYFAIFTTLFFAWLVGPCEVRESDVNGRREKNVVYIKKCRFLEETNCIGMCTNLCKIPSQSFIKESLGMPLNMVPNFDDMSCEMIYGQDPPALTDDPALKQPCYKLCNYFIARLLKFINVPILSFQLWKGSITPAQRHAFGRPTLDFISVYQAMQRKSMERTASIKADGVAKNTRHESFDALVVEELLCGSGHIFTIDFMNIYPYKLN